MPSAIEIGRRNARAEGGLLGPVDSLAERDERAAATHTALDDHAAATHTALDERAARAALRQQVARLERELSQIVAGGFPHIDPLSERRAQRLGGPRLLTLGELEHQRDELALRVRSAGLQAAERSQLELRAQALLEEMKREPARHKFVRLPVRNLGEGGCGVWEVRPRLGLIGMLAGWWQVKLSSGCP